LGGEGRTQYGYGNSSHGIFPYPANYSKVEKFSGVDEKIDGLGEVIIWNEFDLRYVIEDTGNDDFYFEAYWGSPFDNDYTDNQVLDFLLDQFVSIPFSPYTRPKSVRWKAPASASKEDAKYTVALPTRLNTTGLDYAKRFPNGKQTVLTSILNLLLD